MYLADQMHEVHVIVIDRSGLLAQIDVDRGQVGMIARETGDEGDGLDAVHVLRAVLDVLEVDE